MRVNPILSQITDGTYGGKKFPDYIFAYGNNSGNQYIKLAKAFGTKYIFEYDYESYQDKEYDSIKLGQMKKRKNKTNFIREIKSIMENSIDER